jgi:lantibiotic biosynthesis protein
MSSNDAFLAAAAAIGRRIVDDAVWNDGRCAWMGAAVDRKHPWRVEYRALGASPYDGTAGVGLFLAQLAAVTADAATRRTAVGALRHAIERAPELPPVDRDGFHAGVVGIVLAAARAAVLLDEPELDRRARTLLRGACLPSGPDRCPDIVSGSAGAIVGLLALADVFDDPHLVQAAADAGEQLVHRATVTRHGWSWALPGRPFPHHLCGLSHGAAGIGWALMELFAATGDPRFRAGASGAFAYERSWLDAASGTWPDLRIAGHRRGRPGAGGTPATGTWCHGEAGIALTRMRAVAVLGPDPGRREAEVALETTRRHLASVLPYEIDDLSLCHGAAGSADVLMCGAAALGDRSREAAALGRVALERYDPDRGRWPCGSLSGTTPGLFQGLSGIAWWFLRLGDERVPSPLGTWG